VLVARAPSAGGELWRLGDNRYLVDTKTETVELLSDKYARDMLSSINSGVWTFALGHWEMVSIDTRDTDNGELALAYIAARDNRDEPAMSAIEQEATLRIAREWLERNLPVHFPDDRYEDGRTACGADDDIPF
jgi:hypothetical protein